jgi:energy-coupling factor transporter ATP-binding protein EcfA2
MIPVILLASPRAARRWRTPILQDVVLDDGQGTRRVSPSAAARWAAECLASTPEVWSRQPSASADDLHPWICLSGDEDVFEAGGVVVLRDPVAEPEVGAGRAESEWPGARATVLTGPRTGDVLPLPRGETTIGRAGQTVLADPAVSREAVRCVVDERRTVLEPMNPSRRARRRGRLDISHGDEFLLGASRLRFSAGPDLGAARSGLPTAPEPLRVPSQPHGRLRIAVMLLPMLVSVAVALTMRQPMFLLFGLISLGAVLVPIVERASARRAEQEWTLETFAYRRVLGRALFPPVPCAWSTGAPSSSGSQPAAETGPGLDSHGLEASLPFPSVFTTPERSSADPRRSALSPGPSGTTPPLRLVRLGSGVAAQAKDQWDVGLAWSQGSGAAADVRLRVTSPDPHGALRSFLVASQCGSAGPVGVSLHEEDIHPAAARFERVRFTQDPQLLHLCLREHCSWRGSPILQIQAGPLAMPREPLPSPSAAAEPHWSHWVADCLSEDAFERGVAAVLTKDPPNRADQAGTTDAVRESPAQGAHTPSLTLACAHDDSGRPWTLDLAEHGPHVLIVGTTGSGKTELLKTLVVSAVAQSPPDELRLYLIDFKGGSGLGPFAALPHVDDVLTNLGGHDVHRVLLSLEAEMERRQRWLADRGLPDALEAARRGIPGTPPRCIVLIDELKALVDSWPEAPVRLAKIAALGRSLGLHLILANQRAQGAVSSDLRANIGTVLALRVSTESDSLDAVGTRQASSIPSSAKGRMYARTGSDVVGPLQVRRWVTCGRPQHSVRPWGLSGGVQISLPSSNQVSDDDALAGLAARWPESSRSWPALVAPPLSRAVWDELDPSVAGLADDPAHQLILPISGSERSALLLGERGSGPSHAALALVRAAKQDARRGARRLILACPESSPLAAASADAELWSPLSALDLRELWARIPHLEPGDVVAIDGLDTALDELRRLGHPAEEQALLRWLTAGASRGARFIATALADVGRAGSVFTAWAHFPCGVPAQIKALWPSTATVDPVPGRALLSGSWMVEGEPRALLHEAQFERPEDPTADGSFDCPTTRLPGPWRPSPGDAVRTEGDALSLALGIDAAGRIQRVPLRPGDLLLFVGSDSSGSRSAAAFWENCPSSSEILTVVDQDSLLDDAALEPLRHELSTRAVLLRADPQPPGHIARFIHGLPRRPRGLVFSPSHPFDGELLGIKALPFPDPDPGAGWLMADGQPVRVRGASAVSAALGGLEPPSGRRPEPCHERGGGQEDEPRAERWQGRDEGEAADEEQRLEEGHGLVGREASLGETPRAPAGEQTQDQQSPSCEPAAAEARENPDAGGDHAEGLKNLKGHERSRAPRRAARRRADR